MKGMLILGLRGFNQTVSRNYKICRWFKGDIIFDKSKPDGPPHKLLDTSKLNSLGWNAKISLEDGILQTYNWFIKSSGSYNG